MKTFKYRIYPTKKQQTILKEQMEICRTLYNNLLSQRKQGWEEEKKSFARFDQIYQIVQWKKGDDPLSLKRVHSQVLQNISDRIHHAFDSFYRRCKRGQKPGYPRFKSENTYTSLTYTQFGNGAKFKGNRLYLSKIGLIKIIKHRELVGKPKTITIYQSNNKWFVSIVCVAERGASDPTPNKITEQSRIVGIDVGIKKFATLDDGGQIDNPRYFERFQKEIAKVDRRTKFGNKVSEKNKKVINRLYEKVKNCRQDFLHKTANKLLKGNDVVVIEDLNINSMMEKRWCSKQISDCAWRNFFNILSCKAEWAGKMVVKVNPAFTSQDCSKCYYRVTKKLGDRTHNCPSCGYSADRDINAAQNILRLGRQSLGLPPRSLTLLS